MGKSHLKRLNSPKIWGLPRKGTKWVTRPSAGPHALKKSIPLNILLKDFLKIARTTKEVKQILSNGYVKIDNKIRKDIKFPVGLFDTISIENMKKYYRVLLDRKGKFIFKEITDKEVLIKPRKVIKKTIISGNKTQITFYDGYNCLNLKEKIKIDQTAVFDLSTNKIKDVFNFEKGSLIYLTDGKQVGKLGVITEIIERKNFTPVEIEFKIDKDLFKTRKGYALVIGKTKSVVSI